MTKTSYRAQANGQKIEAEIEEKIEAYIDSDEDLPLAECEAMGNVVDYAAAGTATLAT